MDYRSVAVCVFLASAHLLTLFDRCAFAADQVVPESEQEAALLEGESAAGDPTTAAKWYQLQNVTIPADCPLRHEKITKPPLIFVNIKKNGERIFQSTTVKGWEVDFPTKSNIFLVDDPDAVYTIEIWDDCWWNQNVCNITGLKSDAFAGKVYQRGGQYDTKERLLSVQFMEVPAP